MRTKHEMLTELGEAIKDVPEGTQALALLTIAEVLIDIRESLLGLDDRLSELYNILKR